MDKSRFINFILPYCALVYRCFCIFMLWQGFAVPIFGLPSLSLADALGLMALVQVLIYCYVPAPPKTRISSAKDNATIALNSILFCAAQVMIALVAILAKSLI